MNFGNSIMNSFPIANAMRSQFNLSQYKLLIHIEEADKLAELQRELKNFEEETENKDEKTD